MGGSPKEDGPWFFHRISRHGAKVMVTAPSSSRHYVVLIIMDPSCFVLQLCANLSENLHKQRYLVCYDAAAIPHSPRQSRANPNVRSQGSNSTFRNFARLKLPGGFSFWPHFFLFQLYSGRSSSDSDVRLPPIRRSAFARLFAFLFFSAHRHAVLRGSILTFVLVRSAPFLLSTFCN